MRFDRASLNSYRLVAFSFGINQLNLHIAGGMQNLSVAQIETHVRDIFGLLAVEVDHIAVFHVFNGHTLLERGEFELLGCIAGQIVVMQTVDHLNVA